MTAIVLRLRSELRGGWRSWLALALLVGLAGGSAMAAAAGARRTQTAYPRFVKAQRAADLFTGGAPESIDIERAYASIQRFPQVAEWARIELASPEIKLPSGATVRLPEVFPLVNPDGRAGFTFNRFKLLSGRLFDRRSPDEALVDFTTAERLRIRIGSTIGVRVAEGEGSAAFAPVRIVGIVASPGQFPAVGTFAQSNLYLTPAFAEVHPIGPELERELSLLIRLHRGSRDLPSFLREMDRSGLGELDIPATEPVQTRATQKSLRFESQALWILAALIALAGLAILGQSLARQTALESSDYPVLRALGFSRRQLVTLGLLRATFIAATGAAVAAGVAVLLSPLTPIGVARIAEPDPGISVDGVMLAAGAVLTIALVVLSSAVPAWKAARAVTAQDAAQASWVSRRAPSLRGIPLPPAASAGFRLALHSGRGSTAVPVRSAMLGGTLGIAALIASLLFGSSLNHLLVTPDVSGSTWDAFLVLGPEEQERAISMIRADPNVAGYSFPGGFVNLSLGGESVFGFLVDGRGEVGPVIAEGRAPSSAGEIALGTATMRSLNTGIGRRVEVRLDEEGGRPVRMLVVGLAIIPPAPFGQTEQGAGATLTTDGYLLFQSEFSQHEMPVLIRFREGADRDLALSRLLRRLSGDHFAFTAQRFGQSESLGRMATMPVLLSWLLAAIAAATLAHTLVSSVRRRRRDLAILKTLGFLGRQIRGVVAWQATVLMAVSVAIGVPLGVAAGRWGWRAFADFVAVLPVPVIPSTALALLLPGAIVLANLTALVPGAIAARTHPAQVLRSE